jgi:hypothetical protein
MGQEAKKVGTLIGWGAPPLKSYGALEPSLLDHSPRTIMGKKDSQYRRIQATENRKDNSSWKTPTNISLFVAQKHGLVTLAVSLL